MTSQGTAHARFTRALTNRNLVAAEAAARELGRLSLEDAVGLCVLYRQCAAPRFERAAVRQLERFFAERRSTLEQVGLAVGALAEFASPEFASRHGAASMFTLKRLVRRV